MKKIFYFSLFFLSSCSAGDNSDDNTIMRKEYINTIQEVEFLGDGGSQQFDLQSNCNWFISKSVDWLSVTPISGSNNETITLAVGKNTSGEERAAILTIEGGKDLSKRIMVKQTKPTDQTNTLEPHSDDNMPPN